MAEQAIETAVAAAGGRQYGVSEEQAADLRKRFTELEEQGLSPAEMNTFSDLHNALVGNTFPDLNNGGPDLENLTGSDLGRGAPSNKPSPKNPLLRPATPSRLAARKGRRDEAVHARERRLA